MENSFYRKITSWGLLRKLKAEEIIDQNIASIRLPNQDEFNYTVILIMMVQFLEDLFINYLAAQVLLP